MNTELFQIKKIIYATKRKSGSSLRNRVLCSQMLINLYKEYPITFSLSICPNLTNEQIMSVVKNNPQAVKELQLYHIDL